MDATARAPTTRAGERDATTTSTTTTTTTTTTTMTMTTTTTATMVRATAPARGDAMRCARATRANARGDGRRQRVVDARAGKRRGIGDILDDEFSENEGKKKEKKRGGASRDGGAQFERKPMGTSSSAQEKWIKVGNVSELEEKPIKALLLANGNFCMVKYGSMVFITACNSTAYQYPLIDGELFEGPSGAAIRVPLDGTEYDLATGEVITWCPQNNMMRKFLGGLKKAATPVPLAVYPTKIDSEGDVFTYFI